MYRACIAIVDASRARLFTYERTSEAEGLRETMVEQRDLVNPARRLRPSELFSDTRPGLGRTGDAQYGFDDGRDAHIEKLDEDFSRLVLEQVADLSRGARRVIFCASPHMLGELRSARSASAFASAEIDELPRDLVKLTPAQLREQLTSYGLLPVPVARPQ